MARWDWNHCCCNGIGALGKSCWHASLLSKGLWQIMLQDPQTIYATHLFKQTKEMWGVPFETKEPCHAPSSWRCFLGLTCYVRSSFLSQWILLQPFFAQPREVRSDDPPMENKGFPSSLGIAKKKKHQFSLCNLLSSKHLPVIPSIPNHICSKPHNPGRSNGKASR